MKNDILCLLGEDHPWYDRIHWYDTIGSTNTLAKELALQGAPHGTVLIADRQTAGRGRMSRSFHSSKGLGVYMSVLLHPECPAKELMHLTCAAAVAACDAVEESVQFRPGIKWTNDLVWNNRKLAGILTELVHGSHGLAAIVGIGVNCGQASGDFPADIRDIAASLSMVTGRKTDRAALCAGLIRALHAMDARLLTDREATLDRYRSDCITVGREISLVRGDAIRHGFAVGVDDAGALLVRFPEGHTEAVASGEVSIRGMYGYI